MAARIGPVVLTTAGQAHAQSARILAVIWVGTTTAGDVPRLLCPTTGALLWEGIATDTQTYQGANFSPEGINAPHGFQASALPSGTLLVYLREG